MRPCVYGLRSVRVPVEQGGFFLFYSIILRIINSDNAAVNNSGFDNAEIGFIYKLYPPHTELLWLWIFQR